MKDSLFLDICRNDYHAVFQMTRRAIELCPDSMWDERTDEPPFWQQAYHTVFYTDFYLSDSPDAFQDPSITDERAADLKTKPSNIPSQEQLLNYLEAVSEKCDVVLHKLTAEQLEGENSFPWTGPNLGRRMTYNIRHAQHHVGWLNSMLSRKTGKAADWVITAD